MSKIMKALKEAIASLDQTRERVLPPASEPDALEAMRDWRIAASKNHVRRSGLMPAAKRRKP